MNTHALIDALDTYRFDAASAAAAATRRQRGPRSGCSPFATPITSGIRRSSGPKLLGCSPTRGSIPASARASASSPSPIGTELDIWQYVDREQIPLAPPAFRRRAAGGGPRRAPDHGGWTTASGAEPRRAADDQAGAVSARWASIRRRRPPTNAVRHHGAADHRGDAVAKTSERQGRLSSTRTRPGRWRRRSARATSERRPRGSGRPQATAAPAAITGGGDHEGMAESRTDSPPSRSSGEEHERRPPGPCPRCCIPRGRWSADRAPSSSA